MLDRHPTLKQDLKGTEGAKVNTQVNIFLGNLLHILVLMIV